MYAVLVICAGIFVSGLFFLIRGLYRNKIKKHIFQYGKAYMGRVVFLEVHFNPEGPRKYSWRTGNETYSEVPMFRIDEIELDGEPLLAESIDRCKCDKYLEGDEVEVLFLPGYSTKVVIREEYETGMNN